MPLNKETKPNQTYSYPERERKREAFSVLKFYVGYYAFSFIKEILIFLL